ncbi:PREDICTED: uncharacterized protein LOC105588126 isoform X5 [Cercocebus atys]|uniref:uncharacterized protein LOC105588126 isoform X5 n=1 Tax=Cercocebus atys TaxID=9531 RepID=UPI0005F56096|nr:PREDICTED: uncharacterized protein LOC105588126 isoform X5 [Cercocebus atys]
MGTAAITRSQMQRSAREAKSGIAPAYVCTRFDLRKAIIPSTLQKRKLRPGQVKGPPPGPELAPACPGSTVPWACPVPALELPLGWRGPAAHYSGLLTMGRKTDRQTDPQTDDSTCLWGKAWTGPEEDTRMFLLAGDGFSVDLGGHIGSPKEAGEAAVLVGGPSWTELCVNSGPAMC